MSNIIAVENSKEQEEKVTVSVVGAFDRFNYGDMLFPYIVEAFAKNNFKNCSIDFFGLRESDFSAYGAKCTKALKEMPMDQNFVVVAGGDTIQASIEFLYLDNIDSQIRFFLERCNRKIRGGVCTLNM